MGLVKAEIETETVEETERARERQRERVSDSPIKRLADSEDNKKKYAKIKNMFVDLK